MTEDLDTGFGYLLDKMEELGNRTMEPGFSGRTGVSERLVDKQ